MGCMKEVVLWEKDLGSDLVLEFYEMHSLTSGLTTLRSRQLFKLFTLAKTTFKKVITT